MILSDSDVCDIRATKSGLSGGVSVPQFIGDSEAAQTITVSGIEFEITAKEHLDSDKTATILVIGNETGGRQSISVTVRKVQAPTVGLLAQ